MTDKKQQKHERAVEMLEAFGLSENEALIYTYLLERGKEVGGSSIAYGTGLHRQYVYLGLKRLEEMRLVVAVPHGKQNKYQAVAPVQIEKIAKRRLLDAEETVRELNTFSTIGHEQDFEVLQGAAAIQRYELEYVDAAEPGEVEYIIGGHANGFERVMGDVLDEYTGIKDKKKMKVYYVGASETELKRYQNQSSFIPRLLPGFPAGQTHMGIRRGEVQFYSYLEPPLVYIIRSPVIAQNYKDFFMMLWEMAGEKSRS